MRSGRCPGWPGFRLDHLSLTERGAGEQGDRSFCWDVAPFTMREFFHWPELLPEQGDEFQRPLPEQHH